MELKILNPDVWLLGIAVGLDLIGGDPSYGLHPVRLMGRTLTWLEAHLWKLGFNGYGGGILLFLLLSLFWVGTTSAAILLGPVWVPWLGAALHIFILYSLLALHDLLRHAWAVEKAARRNDLGRARAAIARLVGRDTSRMSIGGCRRASIESLSENLADGFISPLFWYALFGIPGIVLFKVVSTMDSMVGYKNERYLKFGWCGARMDDLMNLLPARFTWLLISALAFLMPRCSGFKALRIGWQHHGLIPGPNSGWSEAAMAGALRCRIIGPIWAKGELVTEIWVGDPSDPPAGRSGDMTRALVLTAVAGLIAAGLTAMAIIRLEKYRPRLVLEDDFSYAPAPSRPASTAGVAFVSSQSAKAS